MSLKRTGGSVQLAYPVIQITATVSALSCAGAMRPSVFTLVLWATQVSHVAKMLLSLFSPWSHVFLLTHPLCMLQFGLVADPEGGRAVSPTRIQNSLFKQPLPLILRVTLRSESDMEASLPCCFRPQTGSKSERLCGTYNSTPGSATATSLCQIYSVAAPDHKRIPSSCHTSEGSALHNRPVVFPHPLPQPPALPIYPRESQFSCFLGTLPIFVLFLAS